MSALQRPRAIRLLIATAGLTVWASAFITLYAGLSLGCEGGLHRMQVVGTNALSLLLAGLWLAHLTVHAWVQRYGYLQRHRAGATESDRFLARVTWTVGLAGLAATLLIGVPILFLPPCV